jgi:3-oxoacyl-[acyl-carrier protein] reductase
MDRYHLYDGLTSKKVIVITGTSKGIGCYLSEYYLGKGFTVIGCSRRDTDLQSENYYHYQADISDEKSVNNFSDSVYKKFGGIDALINNAGTASMNHFLFTPASTAKRLMEINYLGTCYCIRSFINLLKKSENPRIVNFSTIAVPLSLSGEIAYVASKGAVEAFTKTLAKEISQFKITVNTIGPAPMDTDLIAHVPKEKLENLMSRQTINRMGKFSTITNVIDFFYLPKVVLLQGKFCT